MVSTLTNVLKSAPSSFKPLERAHAMCTFWANSLDGLLLWNLGIKSQWMVHPFSMMYRDQYFLSKYDTTTMLFKSEPCLKYFVPYLFVPLPLWCLLLNNLEACAFNKMYLHLFDTTLFANVCTSMKSNHLLEMGASKFVKHSKSHKNMLISITTTKVGCNLLA